MIRGEPRSFSFCQRYVFISKAGAVCMNCVSFKGRLNQGNELGEIRTKTALHIVLSYVQLSVVCHYVPVSLII